jgi:DNA mismatch repair protein MutS
VRKINHAQPPACAGVRILINLRLCLSTGHGKNSYINPMTNVEDLHITSEIKPLFDFTCNDHAEQEVLNILLNLPGTEEKILSRQQILKGFISNQDILKDYSFYRFNLSEIHDFLETIFIGSVSARSLRFKFMFSEKLRQQKRGKLILLVRLFYAIKTEYVDRLKTETFPAMYATELEEIKKFFTSFNLVRYETAFNKNKFRIKHMVELIMLLSEKAANGEAAAFWRRWYLFEAYLSVSNGIVKHGFVFPTFDHSDLSLEGFFHPVLKHPVRNDFIASRQVTLLTGPNMSGKSTLLKALSLCVYLGHTGLAVPASRAVMPFFNAISVAINLTDSIVSGYSHFMSEIITLKNVVTEAGLDHRCFAVFDELFRGTNIEDALEISTATIKGLTRFQHSFFFISTHLHQLKDMEEIKSGKVATCFIDCKLTDNVPAFTYKLKEGWSDLKLGRILFEKEGLNLMLQTS